MYSTLDTLVLVPSDDPRFPDGVVCDSGLHLEVQAKSVTLVGQFVMPGRSVKLLARDVVIPPGAHVTIDVSALDPAQTATPYPRPNPDPDPKVPPPADSAGDADWGADGADGTFSRTPTGAVGGTIEIQAEHLTIGKGATLTLRTKGGRGFQGMDGQAGAAGADGSWLTIENATINGDTETSTFGAAQRAGRGGAGGAGALGTDGGAGGAITVTAVLQGEGQLQTDSSGGPPGYMGAGGAGGANGADGGTITTYLGEVVGQDSQEPLVQAKAPSGKHLGIEDSDKAGTHGAPGSVATATSTAAVLPPLFDSSYLLMVLADLRVRMVLSGPPRDGQTPSDDWVAVGQDLDWLNKGIGHIATSTTDLEQARKSALGDQIRTMAGSYHLGRSIDGRTAGWAPPLAFEPLGDIATTIDTVYTDLQPKLTQALADLSTFVDTAARDKQVQEELASSMAKANAAVRASESTLDEVVPQLAESDQLMRTLDSRIAANARLLTNMKDAFQFPSWDKLFSVAESLAFAPGKPMAFTKVGELLYDGWTKVDGLKGQEDKGYAFSELSSAGDDLVAAMQEPGLGSRDARGLKGLVARMEAYKAKIEDIRSALGTAGDDALDLLNQLDSAIQVRGELLARYNAAVQAALRAHRQTILVQRHLDALSSGEAMSSNPLRSGMVALLGHLLQVQRERLLGAYLEARQAWAFKYLADPDDDGPAWMSGQLAVTGAAAFTSQAVQGRLDDLRTQTPDAKSYLGPPKPVPTDDAVFSDVHVLITDPKVLAGLASAPYRTARFTLGPVLDPGSGTVVPAGIEGKGNIHVTKVRVRFPGLTATGPIEIRTTQLGTSRQIFAKVDRTFQHPNVFFDFTWDVGQAPRDYGSGDDGTSDVSGEFAAPGLFGSWQVEILNATPAIVAAVAAASAMQIEFHCLYNAD